jgi:hypothetical protein
MRLSLSLLASLFAACSFAPRSVTTSPDWQVSPLWNGVDLAGWHGQRHFDPYKIDAMSEAERQKLRAEDDATLTHWKCEKGELVNDGEGAYLTTDRDYGDVDFRFDYKTVAKADSGIYLRGTPQVQIWDTTAAGGKHNLGADKGSGGLWNNDSKGAWNGAPNARMPLVLADQPFGEWNSVRILQVGERTSVWLNGKLVVDWAVMENFWNRKIPLRARGPIQLQTHGGEIRFRNLMLHELTHAESDAVLMERSGDGYETLFSGTSSDALLTNFEGAKDNYEVRDGAIRCKEGKGGTLYTKQSYGDFKARLQFRLPPGGNNGLAIRYSGEGDAAYDAIEIQVLDDTAEKYAKLQPWQFHGSLYGLVAAHRGHLRPVGEWNYEEVEVRGSRIRVTLNGTTIVDADVAAIEKPLSGKEHKGRLRTEGRFGFCGHNDPVEFREIAIQRL